MGTAGSAGGFGVGDRGGQGGAGLGGVDDLVDDADLAGAVAAIRVLHRRKLAEVVPELRPQVEAELAAEHEKIAGGIDRAREIGVVDEVVEPTRTRTALAAALAGAEADGRIRGNHGNIPL